VFNAFLFINVQLPSASQGALNQQQQQQASTVKNAQPQKVAAAEGVCS
jgi:hypothetical protein